MRTSEQIHAQIRWDSRFDPTRFVVGIDVHGRPPKRVPFRDFVPGGEIPWHRVLFFEVDGEIVWDRRDGTDRVGDGDAGRARAERRLAQGTFEPRRARSWDEGLDAWVEATTTRAPEADPAPLRLVTWNTLWDRYDADRIFTARRRPLLVEALAALDADVIALQEVEPPLVRALLDATWVRSGYQVTDGPAATDADACGLFVLSRRPILELGLRRFAPHKAALALVIDGPRGPLVVVTVHLTSDHTEGAAARRTAELAALTSDAPAGEAIWLGDFNDGAGDLGARIGMLDAWSAIHGADDATPTFDPTKNPLARVSSRTGRAARLDRVFLRGELRAREAALVGDEPSTEDGLFVSDHAGLVVTVGAEAAGRVLDLAPTARTALAWLAPPEVAARVDPIRAEHDPSYARWPAHVNVLFGFVPEHAFDEAAEIVREVAVGAHAFEAHLEGVRSFEHGPGTPSTAWLDPGVGARGWSELRAKVGARFPACDTRGGKVPHLTIAKGAGELPLGAWARAIGALDARIDRVTLLSRRHDEPMRPRAHVTLGPGPDTRIEWLPEDEPAPTPKEARRRRPDPVRLVERLASALPGAVLHVTGSHRVGCALPDSDVDLVAEVDDARAGAEAIFAALAAAPDVRRLRRVVGARVPGFDFELDGVEVDLAVAQRGDPGSTLALSAAADALAVRAYVEEQGRLDAFLELARSVKRWARAKGLDAAPFGTLPGLAWLVLAARTARAALASIASEPRALLTAFFAEWAAYDWRRAVDFAPGGGFAPAVPAPMTIMTPTSPVRSMTAQVSSDAVALVGEELYAAWEELQRPDAASAERRLFAPPPLHRRHRSWAVVTVEHADLVTRLDRAGKARGRLRGLLELLEASSIHGVHAWPRPWRDGDALHFCVGLGPSDVTARRLDEVTGRWLSGQRDVRVAWRAGGDVPTLR